ncbi:AraC family transcriptional regulator [Faecalicatena contorta]|nr:AraC family transcriptional regulator [Faecalicatena contorta]
MNCSMPSGFKKQNFFSLSILQNRKRSEKREIRTFINKWACQKSRTSDMPVYTAPVLKVPKNTVTDVAYQLNFTTSNPFSSVFRKYTGCTPTYFRAGYFSAFFSALSSTARARSMSKCLHIRQRYQKTSAISSCRCSNSRGSSFILSASSE